MDAEPQDAEPQDAESNAVFSMMRELLGRGDCVYVYARGSSMTPQICDGDRVKIEKKNALKIGDLVAVQMGEKLLIHRMIWPVFWQPGQHFWLKGDARGLSDGRFGEEQLLGQVTQIERAGQKKSNRRIWIGISWMRLVFSSLRSLRQTTRQKRD